MAFGTEEKPKSPFRKAALDRLNNPEQLDRLLTVTRPRSWIALIVFMLLIATAIGWSVFGRLSTYVTGTGLFLNQGGHIVAAVAPGQGTLSQILVKDDEKVRKGQVVARLVSSDAELQITNAQDLVDEKAKDLDRQRVFSAQDLSQQKASFASWRSALRQQQAAAGQRASALRAKLADEESLMNEQIVTRSTVMQTKAQLDQALQDVIDQSAQLSQVDAQETEAVFQADQRVKAAEYALADAKRRLAELVETYRNGSEILAPDTGEIDAIQANTGGLLNRGQPVLTIETPGDQVELVLFVAVKEGGDMLEAGEEVNVSPNWTTREEQGTMLGIVREVSKFPISADEMRTLIQNEDVIRSILAQGPTYVAHVRLKRDPNSVSGYAWTSSVGAEEPISSGGFATADVLVKEDRPIGLVIPTLRRWSGI